ncbi:nitroreductase [Methylobacterium sp. BTF04]|uniref:nitroreductase family protein n=1 Tax=Methylobacterium sp. BTF04 TaxID=2708300 RepID=UPI0013D21632|nr:nitroreductase family protein [Methylobacterium sp. BTF04]NEU14799.1 nitroreductase [Methylobacterium sp. BTF04]
MELMEAIRGRCAVREYTAASIDEQTIRSLIGDAVQAPSAIDEQPWAFTVVRDQALLDRVSSDARTHIAASAVTGSPKGGHFRSMLEDVNFQIFYHAPVLVLISAMTDGDWIVEDCSLAAENLMLAAYAEGLGSCWIGCSRSYLNTPDGKAALRIPEAWTPVAPIILGHPKSTAAPIPRKTPEIRWVG